MKQFAITILAIAISFFAYQYWDGYSRALRLCDEGMNLIEYGINLYQLDSEISKHAFKAKIENCFDMNEVRERLEGLSEGDG